MTQITNWHMFIVDKIQTLTGALYRDVARTFKGGGGGGAADTNNCDRFDAPIALNTREV